jgi:hypothetical protein
MLYIISNVPLINLFSCDYFMLIYILRYSLCIHHFVDSPLYVTWYIEKIEETRDVDVICFVFMHI